MGLIYSYRFMMGIGSNACGFEDTLDYLFPDEDPSNGLLLNNVYLPEEIIIHILSLLPVEEILKLRLVCKKWYNLTKTHSIWSTIFIRINKNPPKKLPWYVYYKYLEQKVLDKNLMSNNCGQENLSGWLILNESGSRVQIENNPVGCEPLPTDVSDFDGAKSCFVSSYFEMVKAKLVPFEGGLTRHIIKKFKPHIYVSEWYAGRFDCGGTYELTTSLFRNSEAGVIVNNMRFDADFVFEKKKKVEFLANEATKWQKVEIIFDDYPDDVDGVLFQHKAKDNQFWAGYYGPKMSGGVVKLLFDSIEPKLNVSSSDKENDLSLNDIDCGLSSIDNNSE